MLSALIGFAGGAVVLVILYFVRLQRATKPSIVWKRLAAACDLNFDAAGPSLEGTHEGRKVAVADLKGSAKIALQLKRRSRLRVEAGPKAVVTKRAGLVVPDPVATGDFGFDERFLVRCSDKAAGERMMESAMRQRLSALPDVDFIGQDDSVQWTVPLLNDSEVLDEILACMTAIAAEMESYPA